MNESDVTACVTVLFQIDTRMVPLVFSILAVFLTFLSYVVHANARDDARNNTSHIQWATICVMRKNVTF